MNVVFQTLPLPPDKQFDLVIGTNIFVYYGGLEQSLARANLGTMIKPGGFLLTNEALPDTAPTKLTDSLKTSVPIVEVPGHHRLHVQLRAAEVRDCGAREYAGRTTAELRPRLASKKWTRTWSKRGYRAIELNNGKNLGPTQALSQDHRDVNMGGCAGCRDRYRGGLDALTKRKSRSVDHGVGQAQLIPARVR